MRLRFLANVKETENSKGVMLNTITVEANDGKVYVLDRQTTSANYEKVENDIKTMNVEWIGVYIWDGENEIYDFNPSIFHNCKIVEYDVEDDADEDYELIIDRDSFQIGYYFIGDEEEQDEALEWAKYIIYLKNWVNYHDDPVHLGSSPVCFDEWEDNEYIHKIDNVAKLPTEEIREARAEDIENNIEEIRNETVDNNITDNNCGKIVEQITTSIKSCAETCEKINKTLSETYTDMLDLLTFLTEGEDQDEKV